MAKRKILTSSSSSLPAGFGSAASNSKSFLENPASPKTDQNQASLKKFLETKCKSGTVTPDEAFRFFDYMTRIKPTPPVSAFNVLLAAVAKVNFLAKEQMLLEANALLEFMAKRGQHPTTSTCTTFMDNFCKKG